MPGGGDAGWRDRAAVDLVLRHLGSLDLSGPFLVMEDPLPALGDVLSHRGFPVAVWSRRALGGRPAAPWPPAGPFGTAVLRLPRSREETRMALHAAATVLRPDGSVLVYGANDEGIRPAAGLMQEVFTPALTVGVGGRCRVLHGHRAEEVPGLKHKLEAWKEFAVPGYPGLPPHWISYPGVFAHGRLDPGTRLLLDVLPPFPSGARVLDFGCGSGIVGAVVMARGEGVTAELSDVDTVALEAARENVPGATLILADGLERAGGGPFDAIVSNPPLHRGKAEDPSMLATLIEGAPALLGRLGTLVFVAQRRFPVEGALRRLFRKVSVLGEDPVFRVWEGKEPRRGRAPG